MFGPKKILTDGIRFTQLSGNNMNLDEHLTNYTGIKGSVEERFMTKATLELAVDLCVKKNVLILGLGNGFLSKEISNIADRVDILEGSEAIITEFKFENPNTTIYPTYFEDYSPNNKYDVVLANHVLEHVDDPVSILKDHCARWINESGIVFVTVPNANSLHRRIGKEMNMLDSIFSLNKSDINAGHQRVYDLEGLFLDIDKSGLKIESFGGYNLKLVSLEQMADWSQNLLNAIFEVSKNVPPEICSNLWAILKK